MSRAYVANEADTGFCTHISARQAITATVMMPAITYEMITAGPAMPIAEAENSKKPDAIVPPTDSITRCRTRSARRSSPAPPVSFHSKVVMDRLLATPRSGQGRAGARLDARTLQRRPK